MVTVSVGFHEAVLMPDRAVGTTTCAAPPPIATALPSATVIEPVSVTAPALYETVVDEEPSGPVKAVDAADTAHAAVPPRASVTNTRPSVPLTAVVPAASGPRSEAGCTVRARRPPVISNVVAVVAAEAGTAVPARRAVAAAAMVRCWRRFTGLPLLRAGGLSAALLPRVSAPGLQR